MKYIKMLGLLAVTAAALMAFTGTASATTATSPAGTAFTSTIHFESSNSRLHGSFITVECSGSTFHATIDFHGSAVTAEGGTYGLTFSGCNYTVTVKKAGSVIAHATSGGNGTITSSGAEIAIHTSVGECIFTTSGTDIGTLTGGTGAKLDIDSAGIPRTGGSFFCGSSGEWTGNYTITSPSYLSLD